MAGNFLDIKSMMRAVDSRDKTWYDRLSDDDKKLYSPYMTMKWSASVEDYRDFGPESNRTAKEWYIEVINEKVNKNVIKILTEKLVKWTGERWIISLSKSVGKKTLFEKQNDEKKQEIEDARTNSKIKSLLNTFSDAKLINVEKKEE